MKEDGFGFRRMLVFVVVEAPPSCMFAVELKFDYVYFMARLQSNGWNMLLLKLGRRIFMI